MFCYPSDLFWGVECKMKGVKCEDMYELQCTLFKKIFFDYRDLSFEFWDHYEERQLRRWTDQNDDEKIYTQMN